MSILIDRSVARVLGIILLSGSLLLSACTDKPSEPLLYRVHYSEREALVPAQGELEAESATAIQAPTSGPPKFISWLAPEYSLVKKGDVIARFDGEQMRRKRSDAARELTQAEEDLREKRGALDTEQVAILADIGQVSVEKGFAERFAIDDDRLKSRLEILEEQLDTRYLQSKLTYLDWKNQRFATGAEGELAVLSVLQQKHSAQIQRLDQGMSELQIVAPHDGMLTYTANWRGEKPQVGTQVWPGHKVADLPDTSVMQAKLQVAEREAVGLAEGQVVTLWFETQPAQHFSAKVKSISAAPSTIERGNPQKYYQVVAAFDEQYPAQFKLDRGVRAEIRVADAERRLEIPAQCVFRDGAGAYVFLYQQGRFLRRDVSTGRITPTHIEIIGGLEPGDQIALYEVSPGNAGRRVAQESGV
ncbi:HlyD family efflux transporter periplasmic adaptor subunit [uncultured Microbulbifer sp.]|uniref:efflux RND transporter periplasmic adaptor subunit n=1 Tax=uncultured Microbulbifer sp. TaxID=348147 RepID=UPI0025CCC455|nr:HlyD family efflux transporter periplasmic adaptor subunit [uncultured Microbulbifer sp.]